MKVVNLIPTYNEAENIGDLLRALTRIAKKNSKYTFITLIVDDNSPDGTGEIAKSYKGVKVLSGQKKGLGVAMMRGINYALIELKADIVISNEADMSFNPNVIPVMLERIAQGYDVVVASRHIIGGRIIGWSTGRRLNHFLANTVLANYVAGIREVRDHNGACRAVKRRVLVKTNWTNMPKGFGFFNFWMYRMTQVTNSICEIPIVYTFRTKGESKISFSPRNIRNYATEVWEYVQYVMKIRWWRIKIEQ